MKQNMTILGFLKIADPQKLHIVEITKAQISRHFNPIFAVGRDWRLENFIAKFLQYILGVQLLFELRDAGESGFASSTHTKTRPSRYPTHETASCNCLSALLRTYIILLRAGVNHSLTNMLGLRYDRHSIGQISFGSRRHSFTAFVCHCYLWYIFLIMFIFFTIKFRVWCSRI